MPSDLTWFERLRGKRYGNIDLPADGPRDPKLPDVGNKVKQGIDQLKTMREHRKAYRSRIEEALNRK